MKPSIFVNSLNDPKPKKVLFDSDRLWVVVEDDIAENVKDRIKTYISAVVIPLLSRNNREVKIVVETTSGKDLYALHNTWKEGYFPKETKFERTLGKFHHNNKEVDRQKQYLRMEVNQIESEAGHGSWFDYSGEYTSIVFDEDLGIVDTKSERAT